MQLSARINSEAEVKINKKVILLTFEDALSWCVAAAIAKRRHWWWWWWWCECEQDGVAQCGWRGGRAVSYGNAPLSKQSKHPVCFFQAPTNSFSSQQRSEETCKNMLNIYLVQLFSNQLRGNNKRMSEDSRSFNSQHQDILWKQQQQQQFKKKKKKKKWMEEDVISHTALITLFMHGLNIKIMS